MTMSTDSLRDELERHAAHLEADTTWTFIDLATFERIDSRGDEPVPVGDFDSLVWYLAATHAGHRGELDLSVKCTLEDRHRRDGNRGVIGCMSNGLELSLGDFLAQTVITGDPAAFAVAVEAIDTQGVAFSRVVDRFLREQGIGGLEGRPALSPVGQSGVALGSTTTNEQAGLLRHLVEDAQSTADHGLSRSAAERCLTVLSSGKKGGGLGRGLPGYGPFITQVAHAAPTCAGIAADVRNDSAVFFDEGTPRYLVSASAYGIPRWQGEFPGRAVAEDFLMDVSRSCWALRTRTP